MIYHNNFDGTSFNQTAAEYIALCQQTYFFADRQLRENLKAIASGAKPCVIFDLDETVLDNSPANAALIRDGKLFNEKGNWKEWCNLGQTELVPGAKPFVDACKNVFGVAVFYITSRQQADVRAVTRTDLKNRHNLPLELGDDPMTTNLFMKNMGQFDAPSGRRYTLDDKFQQRDFLIRELGYTVALILGDNLSDWLPQFGNSVDYRQRVQNLLQQQGLGQDFILIPNPMYGSWLITLTRQCPDSIDPATLQPVTSAESPRLGALRFPA